jgi:hypothetical protein
MKLKHMHKLVGLHDTVGSVRLRRDNKAVQYSPSYMKLNMYGLAGTSSNIATLKVKESACFLYHPLLR